MMLVNYCWNEYTKQIQLLFRSTNNSFEIKQSETVHNFFKNNIKKLKIAATEKF